MSEFFPRLKPSITTRIIVLSIPVIAIVSVIIWCPSIIEFQKRETEKYQSFAEKQAELIKKSIHFSMLRNQKEHIEEVIDSVSSMENTLWIRITDKNDTIKVSSWKNDVGRRCPEECAELDKGQRRILKEIGGKRVLLLSMPIENMKTCYTASCHFHREDEKVLGRIELAMDYDDIHKKVWKQGITVASFGLVFTSTLSIVLYILVRLVILRRVTLLSEASRKVADGDLSVSIPVSEDRDEIGQLSEVFNNMVSELRKKKEAMDKELNGYRQSLIQAQKMEAIGLLASGVAHDFNNILTGIIGFSELMLLKAQDKETKETLERIISSAERGSDLTRQILLVGRKVPPQRKPLDINTFVDDSYKMLRRMVEENIELRTSLRKGIPCVNADIGQITQVLMNLVVNARDAISDSGTITISTDEAFIDESYANLHPEAKSGHYVVLSVRDTGIGISDDIKDKIFNPFFTTKEKGKGTGLGLAVTYGIVSSHDGWISVYSEKGKGTEFRVYLPAMETSAIIKEQKESAAHPMPFTSSLILLVDDEEMVRDVGRSMLESLGYKVITASNGKEAVEIYREKGGEIGLITMDLVMPVMDGLNAFREIKKINPDAKVIISSGYSADNMDILKKEGVSGFINKPYRLGEIVGIISKVLDEKS